MSSDNLLDFGNIMDLAGLAAEQNEKHRKEISTLLLGFLEVVDSIEALGEHCEELVAAGHQHIPARTVNTVLGQARNVLRRMEVEPMKAVGQPLNLNWHDVDAIDSDSSVEQDIVLKEKVRGYLWKGTLLRRAKVVISS